MCNNLNLAIVDINAYTKFGETLPICSEDIERKQNHDELTDGQDDRQNDGWNDGQHKSVAMIKDIHDKNITINTGSTTT